MPINQAQFDALTDIVYNMGCYGATRYGIWSALNSGNYNLLYELIKNRYTLANKIFWPGLSVRASEEAMPFKGTSPNKCVQVSAVQAGI
jgi:GH24 family phage-related lysozyme (muramidase)